jgi:hypothetical protein
LSQQFAVARRPGGKIKVAMLTSPCRIQTHDRAASLVDIQTLVQPTQKGAGPSLSKALTSAGNTNTRAGGRPPVRVVRTTTAIQLGQTEHHQQHGALAATSET